jgi:hypothetical protein
VKHERTERAGSGGGVVLLVEMCPEANRLVLISGTVVPVRNEAEVDHGANRTVRDVHGGGEGDELLHVRGVHFVV